MVKVPLSGGGFSIVDGEDSVLGLQHSWFKFKNGKGVYARCRIGSRYVQMHRMILGVSDPKICVDHENHIGLDNRRLNIRISTKSQNGANTRKYKGASVFKGVAWHKRSGKWRAQITKTFAGKEKQKLLGCYEEEREAALVYNVEAIKAFGEFALLNTL